MKKVLNKEISDTQVLTIGGIIVMLLMGWLVVKYNNKYHDSLIWEKEYKKDVTNIVLNEKDSVRRKELINRLKK